MTRSNYWLWSSWIVTYALVNFAWIARYLCRNISGKLLIHEDIKDQPERFGVGAKFSLAVRKRSNSSQLPDWKFCHRHSEKLMPFAIVGARVRAPLKPLGVMLPRCSRGFRRPLNGLPMMRRDDNLPGSCTFDRCRNCPRGQLEKLLETVHCPKSPHNHPDCGTLHRLSERLTFLGIMGSNWGSLLNSSIYNRAVMFKVLFWWTMRDASLSDSCTSDGCSFSRLYNHDQQFVTLTSVILLEHIYIIYIYGAVLYVLYAIDRVSTIKRVDKETLKLENCWS